jgi:hypothetical protein
MRRYRSGLQYFRFGGLGKRWISFQIWGRVAGVRFGWRFLGGAAGAKDGYENNAILNPSLHPAIPPYLP